jgi:hypothetical protein
VNTSELTDKARGIARCLTYNDDEHQSAAKHMLLEMAHRLDSVTIRAHNKSDGILLINGIGKSRYATFIERIVYRITGTLPKTI